MSTSSEKKCEQQVCETDNLYEILDGNSDTGSDNIESTSSLQTEDIKPLLSEPSRKWGDAAEPCYDVIMKEIDKNILLIDYHEDQMVFLSKLVSKTLSLVNDIINTQKQSILDSMNTTGEKEGIRHFYDLIKESNTIKNSLEIDFNKMSENIVSVSSEKEKIISSWNNVIKSFSDNYTTPKVSPLLSPTKSFVDANNRTVTIRKPISYLESMNKEKKEPGPSNVVYAYTTLGKVLADGSLDKNDTSVSIKYNETKKYFVIRLNGHDYSFTDGSFIQRDKRNPVQTVVKYGKRCDSKRMLCNGSTCTYYHDPLKFSQHEHSSRNFAMSYITEELIKNVSDEDYIANINTKNPFIVEDIVQLAGMLLIKAMSVKKTLR